MAAKEHTRLLGRSKKGSELGRSKARTPTEPTLEWRRQHHRVSMPHVFGQGRWIRIRVLTLAKKRNKYCLALHTTSIGNKFGSVQLKYLLCNCRLP